ncbi:alpha/beta hydrolase [Streptomyces peucetius]|uniref:Alpha/beta hydrolase n=1 Tax=Streptomyces peucetius TaxID=1950 RepID=A0ABY6IB84_STRPE|nr:alpha/beta hydrolase [Streptomyces peucetius]UYQ64261.1 alpha/beta hydrolase [Streptomyces peucetius]
MPKFSTAARTAAAATVTAVLLAAAGCSDGGNGDEDRPQDLAAQQLEWRPCPAPSEAQGGGPSPSPLPGGTGWECSFMDVPLDYGKPDGETIELALIRAPARDQENRIGSLVFNFGGPGASGVHTLPSLATEYDDLRGRYDLVSFDPRGVGRSVPVECLDDRELDQLATEDPTPDDPAEEKEFLEGIERFTDACEENSGDELPYVGTINAARDLDLMRQVLGDERLYYFGISYGTELGGVYAHLYPKNVGRAVFDAVVDPTLTTVQGALGQVRGFQLALTNFAEDCLDRGDDCRLPGSSVQEIEDWIIGFLARLDKKPIQGIGERMLTEGQAANGIIQALYSQEYWKLLEQALDEADGGNGGLLMAFSDALNGRSENGTYSNMQAAGTAIGCVDTKARYTVDEAEAMVPEFRKASPVFGEYLAWGQASCTDWPVPGTWVHPDVSAPGAAPIVLVGNTGDPATPYKGTQAMARALGEGVAVTVTYEGEGHGSYSSSACVRKAVNTYLLDGRPPSDGTVCR